MLRDLSLVLVIGMLLFPSLASGQTSASFRGTVRDQSGAAMPAPRSYQERANRRGADRHDGSATARYVAASLKPSIYTLARPSATSRRWNTRASSWLPARIFYIDLELQPAGVTETVTVSGEAPAPSTSVPRASART